MEEPFFKVENLKKSYPSGFLLMGKTRVLKDVNINAKKGEIYSFLGPNGAGKTTTFKIIIGISEADGGKIVLDNKPIGIKAKDKIGFLPERPYFYDYLSGKEYLQFSANLFNLKDSNKRIEYLLELTGLKKSQNVQLKNYSKGMLQRLGIAQAVINDPDLIILDEPLGGLDPIGRKTLKDMILSLKEEGKTIIFSSHILQDAEMISDRIGIIVNGKTVKEGKLEKIIEEKIKEIEICISGIDKLPPNIEAKRAEKKQNLLYITVNNEDKVNQIVNKTVEKGGEIKYIRPLQKSLEDIFMEYKDEENISNS